jgi:alcohol dehydrogenase class IV
MSKVCIYSNISSLLKLLERLDLHEVFLVSGKKSFEILNNKFDLKSILSKYKVTYFSDFEVNPKYEDLLNGLSIKDKINPEVIIAIGGGSVIDMAKLLYLFDDSIELNNYLENKADNFKHINRHLIVIPTTSGSGSESTHFAVLYKDKKKYSIASKHILPNNVILDFNLTTTNSFEQTLYSALDAFCQANESLWSIESNIQSQKYALKALDYLLSVFSDFSNYNTDSNRKSLQLGAFYSGKAINISKTNAPHALSYYLTERNNIPHGLAVFLIFNKIGLDLFNCINQNLKDKINHIYLSHGFISFNDSIIYLNNLLPIKISIIDLIHSSSDRIEHINSVNLERLKNSPIIYTMDELYLKIYNSNL